MKKILAVLVLAFSGLALISCGDATVVPKNTTTSNNSAPVNTAPATSANADADVKKLISDLGAALSKNDVAALDKIYADDYTLVTATGDVATKAQRLDAIKSGDLKFENVSFSNVKVRTYGDTAVAIVDSTGKNTVKGKTSDTNYRVTFVANKTKDGWRLVSAHLVSREDATKTDDAAKTNDANKMDATKKDAMKEDVKKDEPKKENDKK